MHRQSRDQRVSPRRLNPDEARILARLKRLAPQRSALTLALEPFLDEARRFDRTIWMTAFESDDAEDIYQHFPR